MMTDKELRDAALVKLNSAYNTHWKKTTVGYARMKQPISPTSEWGMGEKDFNDAIALLKQIGVEPVPQPLPDTKPPSVTITSPQQSTTVAGTVPFQVNALDDVGVTKVEFFVDGQHVPGSPVSSPPFRVSLDTSAIPDGTHSLVVRAYDAAGNVGRHEIVVTVGNVVPSKPIYWGGVEVRGEVYGAGYGNAPWAQNTWDKFEQSCGKKISLIGYGQRWMAWDTSVFNTIRNRGAYASIAFQNLDSAGVKWSLADIAAGKQDAAIDAWALKVKNSGWPFLFRPWWEMNGSWAQSSDWFGPFTPAEYIAAWKRFKTRCDAVGATNITWAWCCNQYTGTPTASVADPRAFYPGPSYVDWHAFDAYPFAFQSTPDPTSILKITYDLLKSLDPTKPIALLETGCDQTAGKDEWITKFLDVLPSQFPQIKAFVWFNWPITEHGGVHTYPIESSPESMAAFKAGISDSYYLTEDGPASMIPALFKVKPL